MSSFALNRTIVRTYRGTPARIVLDGRALHGTAWGEGPPVHLLHGWGGRSEQLTAFVRPLVLAGHRVVAVDTPAHGGSGRGVHGRRAGTIPEFAAALRAARAGVHDRGDREVGVRDGREIAGAWPGARLVATDGLGHRRLLRDGAVVAAVVDVVTAPALERSA